MIEKEREIGFDLLRDIAAFFVVVIHVCSMEWSSLVVDSPEWLQFTLCFTLSLFSVPVFFMVSGAFLLDSSHKTDIKTIFTKRIKGIVIPFVFWSLIYTIINFSQMNKNGSDIKAVILEFFTGEYHMWFLFALAGLYIITPVLKMIANDERICRYFLLLFVIVQLVLTNMSSLPKVGVFIKEGLGNAQMNFVMGYSGYYVLGYYLKKHPVEGKKKAVLYVCGVLGVLYSLISLVIASRQSGKTEGASATYLTLNVALFSAAVYCAVLSFCKNRKFANTARSFIYAFSAHSFGIYLAHPLVLTVFKKIGFVPTLFTPALSIPIISICAFVISFALSWALRKIPKIGKMIT